MNIPASEKLSILAGHTDHGRLFESRLVVSLGICAAHHFISRKSSAFCHQNFCACCCLHNTI